MKPKIDILKCFLSVSPRKSLDLFLWLDHDYDEYINVDPKTGDYITSCSWKENIPFLPLDSKNPKFHYEYATLLVLDYHRYDEALKHYKKAELLLHRPIDAELKDKVLTNFGFLYLMRYLNTAKKRDLEKAKSKLGSVKAMTNKSLFGLAYIAQRSGNFQAAIQNYSAAIRLHPTVYAYLNRGLAYDQVKHTEKALSDVENYLELNEGDIEAQQFKESLESATIAHPSTDGETPKTPLIKQATQLDSLDDTAIDYRQTGDPSTMNEKTNDRYQVTATGLWGGATGGYHLLMRPNCYIKRLIYYYKNSTGLALKVVFSDGTSYHHGHKDDESLRNLHDRSEINFSKDDKISKLTLYKHKRGRSAGFEIKLAGERDSRLLGIRTDDKKESVFKTPSKLYAVELHSGAALDALGFLFRDDINLEEIEASYQQKESEMSQELGEFRKELKKVVKTVKAQKARESAYKTRESAYIDLALYQANQGDLASIKHLHDSNVVDLKNLRDASGQTLLHRAAIHGHVELVEFLMDEEHGLNMPINEKDSAGDTALHLATRYGYISLVKMLINHPNIQIKANNLKNLPYHEAARTGHLTCLNVLIRKFHQKKLNLKNKEGRSVVLEAAYHRQFHVVESLCTETGGVDLSTKSKEGTGLLHYLAYHPKLNNNSGWSHNLINMMRKLTRRIDVNEKNEYGYRPIHAAIQSWNLAYYKWLVRRDVGASIKEEVEVLTIASLVSEENLSIQEVQCNLMHFNVMVGGLDTLHALLTHDKGSEGLYNMAKAKAVLGESDQYVHGSQEKMIEGGTVLHVAIHMNRMDMVDKLMTYDKEHLKLESRGMVYRNQNKQTALTYSVALNRLQFIERLVLKYRVKIDQYDGNGWTPLHWAAYLCPQEDPALVDRLCELGASREINRKDGDALTKVSVLVKLPENKHIPQRLKEFLSRDENCSLDPNRTFTHAYPTSLVFQGGGVKGLAYVGALKALSKKLGAYGWMHVRRVVGTSAGAITAGFLAIGYSPDELNNLLNDTDFGDFLDNPILQEAEAVQSGDWEWKEMLGKIYKAYGVVSDWFKTGINPAELGRKLVMKIAEVEGLCPGDVLRNWLVENIDRKIGDLTGNTQQYQFLTFGDLNELIQRNEHDGLKHLHLMVTNVSTGELMHLSSENHSLEKMPWLRDVLVADAIRASASLPFVFEPAVLRQRILTDGGYKFVEMDSKFMDGGMLKNYPLDVMDKRRYVSSVRSDNSELDYTFHNHEVLGFRLLSNTHQETAPEQLTGMKDLIKAVGYLYYNAEEAQRKVMMSEEAYRGRTVELDSGTVGTADFYLTSEQKEMLLKNGEAGTKHYFESREIYYVHEFREQVAAQPADGVLQDAQRVVHAGGAWSVELAGKFEPNVHVVYDKHRRGYAVMRETLGFKLLHAVSAPARLLSDAFGSKRPIVMTQSSDSFSLTLPEASADVTSSSEVNAIDTNRALSLMPNLSFEETYYTQPELPFDAGAWDPQIDQHPDTGAPIFTYRVFEHGEEVGSARFYQHPMLCRSKAGNRHNVLELRGVLDQLDTDTMAAHTDEICASLPPTLIERLGESGTRGVKWGAWRGITGVVEHGMKRRGYSSRVSKWATQGVFYGGLFVSNLYQRVSVKQAQGQELTNEDMLSATTEALVDTGTVFASQQLLSRAGQALHATGEGLTRRGWTKTGGALRTVSGWLGYGMYGAMAYRQGVGQALTQVVAGGMAETVVTRAGTAVVDRVVPEYRSPLGHSVNSSEAPAVETGMSRTVADLADNIRFDPVKEEEDDGAGMGLSD